MAGHSHSANIAHRKGLVDAKRGKLFSKLCRAIYVAARTGGGDPSANIRLRYAIDKARSFSCPKENIERSIKKATGELGAENFEEVVYEGYGPGGVAVLCEALTDNRNRTAGELRRAFEVGRRQPRRQRLRQLPVQFQGAVRRRPQARRRGPPDGGGPRGGGRRRRARRGLFRGHLRPQDLRDRAQGPGRRRRSPPRAPRPATSRRPTSTWTSRGARRCSSSGTSSTRTTTSRTSMRTTTSPRRRWPERVVAVGSGSGR